MTNWLFQKVHQQNEMINTFQKVWFTTANIFYSGDNSRREISFWHFVTCSHLKTVNGVEKYKWVQSAAKWQKNLEKQERTFSLQNIEV